MINVPRWYKMHIWCKLYSCLQTNLCVCLLCFLLSSKGYQNCHCAPWVMTDILELQTSHHNTVLKSGHLIEPSSSVGPAWNRIDVDLSSRNSCPLVAHIKLLQVLLMDSTNWDWQDIQDAICIRCAALFAKKKLFKLI